MIVDMKQRLVLGIDPGLAATGYAILSKEGSIQRCLEYDTVKTAANDVLENRLFIIQERLLEIYQKYKIESCAIENIYFQKNVSSAILVAHAIGVMMISARQHHVPVYRYSPTEIKQAICGDGKAEKEQIKRMLGILFPKVPLPKSSHAADAIAIAVCHLATHRLKSYI